jgi:hypothetical protein
MALVVETIAAWTKLALPMRNLPRKSRVLIINQRRESNVRLEDGSTCTV